MKNKFLGRALVLAVALSAGIASAYARQLLPAEAIERVRVASGAKRLASAKAKLKLLHTENARQSAEAAFYVFGSEGADGFVIASADDRLVPVLGVADRGAFSEIPENMRWWLDQYAAEIGAFYAANPRGEIVSPYDNYASWAPIEPLVKCSWDQGAPYNNECPTVNGERTVTGCVATALAQAVRTIGYYKGQSTNSYSNDKLGYKVSFDFGSYKPDFANMKDSYSGKNTADEVKAVADLMLACGVAVNSTFNVGSAGGTGAVYRLDNIRTYLGYTETFQIGRSGLTTAEWERLCYDILATGKPLCYGGSGSGSHAFICDGYSADGLFHFNWGWSGMSNGYFRMSALNPRNQGIGSFEGGYSLGQAITVLATSADKFSFDGVRPGVVKWQGNNQLQAPYVKGGVMSFSFVYQLVSTLRGKSLEVGIGLLLKNRSGSCEEVIIKPAAYRTMAPSATEYDFTLSPSGADLEKGAQYDAYPIYFCKGYEGWWMVEPTSAPVTDHYLLTVSAGGDISAVPAMGSGSAVDAYDMTTNEIYSTDDRNEFHCLLVNHSETDFSEALVLRMVNPKTGAQIMDIATSYLMLPAGETMPLDATFKTNGVAPGSYQLMLCRRSNGYALSQDANMAITVLEGKRPEDTAGSQPALADTYQIAMWADGKMQPMAPVSVLAGQPYSATTSFITPYAQTIDYSLAFYAHGDLKAPIAKFPIAKVQVEGKGMWEKGSDFKVEPNLAVGAYTMAFVNQKDGLVSYPTDFLVGTVSEGITYNYDAAAGGLVATTHSLESPVEIAIPAEVESTPVVGVADEAFNSCRELEKLSLPASVKSIGVSAFRGASKLAGVKFEAEKVPFANVAVGFPGVNPKVEYYVPAESFAAYSPAFTYRGRVYASIQELSLPDTAYLTLGLSRELPVVVKPSEKINSNFSVEVSDPTVVKATFDGKNLALEPVALGTAIVSLKSAEPFVEPARVEVAVNPVEETSIGEISADQSRAEYFDLCGRRIGIPRGLIIERRGTGATLILRR